MKLKSWLILTFFIGLVFYLSSIPGLQVLPFLRNLNSILLRLDLNFVRLSEWLATRTPIDFSELGPLRTLSRDFLLYTEANPAKIEFLLRKMAHVIIFFFITVAFFLLASQYTKKSTSAIIIAFFGGTVMSFLDEYRQSFVPNRIASLTDVFINIIGVSLAILFILFSLFITKGTRIKSYNKKYEKQDKEDQQLEKTTLSINSDLTPLEDEDTKIYMDSKINKVNKVSDK